MNAQSKKLSSKSTPNEKGHHFYINSNPSVLLLKMFVKIEPIVVIRLKNPI